MKKVILIIALLILTFSGYAVSVEKTANLNVYYPEYSRIEIAIK